mmetsp:Transcript_4631/g.14066  ORF Transcript_4631/g.14066 Transcript_4631/m.14066 type:complete len:295 (-) Transcript_4631:669-1553(-)
MPKSEAYCFRMAFLGFLMTCTSCSSVRASREASTGNRPTNSGIRPKLIMSMCSTLRVTLAATSAASSSPSILTWAPNPMEVLLMRSLMTCSSPTKAPPQMNRMFFVSIWMYSTLGCFLLPFSGTFTIVPSSILSRACCTPSPLTSLDEEDLVLFATLSISSMYTIPLSARCRLCPAACSSLLRMFSTSSPTYPAWVSAVASLSTSGTFTSLARVCARRVFPDPVGPSIRMLDFSGCTSLSLKPGLNQPLTRASSAPPRRSSPEEVEEPPPLTCCSCCCWSAEVEEPDPESPLGT